MLENPHISFIILSLPFTTTYIYLKQGQQSLQDAI